MARQRRKHSLPSDTQRRRPLALERGMIEAVHLRADDKGKNTLAAVEIKTEGGYRFHAYTLLAKADGLIGRKVIVRVEPEEK